MNPKISVIIPCYNHGEYIEDAVDSVLRQTFRNYEIIIVNDGSTDEYTVEILKKIKKNHPEISVIDQENGHVASARNMGIKKSKGEFILSLDADDKIEPSMIEKCLAEIEKDEKLGFVYTNTRYFGEYNFVYRRQEYNFYDLLLANYIVATSLFRKKAWEDVGGYDENMKEGYEDWEFFIRLGKKGWHGRLIEEPLFFYRKHGKSVNYDARKQHDSIVEYIRGKHRNLYSKEGLLKIKKEWDEKNIFSSIYKKIIKELLSIRIKLILAGILDGDDWKSYPFRTLGRCVPIRIKEIINKVFGKEILDTKYFRRNL